MQFFKLAWGVSSVYGSQYEHHFINICNVIVQVETIGDAYMVSSGIPISNPRHAPELADMALALCHGVTKFKVRNIIHQVIGAVVDYILAFDA